jgi:transcription elongation factor Elf1
MSEFKEGIYIKKQFTCPKCGSDFDEVSRISFDEAGHIYHVKCSLCRKEYDVYANDYKFIERVSVIKAVKK